MAASRHAGHAGPCLFGRCASARHQGERTSTSRQTCCPLRFPRCAGSSGISSGQGRPTPVASSLGRTGDDDTSSAPDDHTGRAEPELINPGCSTKRRLLTYNAEDCEAVQRVAEALGEICLPRTEARTPGLEPVDASLLLDKYKRMFRPLDCAIPLFKQINNAS